MKKSLPRVSFDGPKLAELRMERRLTQQKLAYAIKINVRTLQRAENGQPIKHEIAALLAKHFRKRLFDLEVKNVGVDLTDLPVEEEGLDERESNVVVLHRITSGRRLLEIVCQSFSGSLFCDIEPTVENIDLLGSMAERFESLVPDPWVYRAEMSLAERLRTAVVLTQNLASLEDFNIAVFAGTYIAMAKRPRYDSDGGHMYTSITFPLEPVIICRIKLSAPNSTRVLIKVADKWIEPQPTDREPADDRTP